jgi:predicted amidohydrolase
MNQITKVGFYNPQKPDAPLDTFAATLEGMRRQLAGSLLVLPEAFNIGTSYFPNAEIQKDPRTLWDLQGLCSDFDICIVAGLIISANRPASRTLQFFLLN